jgi:hypothetical protein
MTVDRRMFRYEVPIDDSAHVIPLSRPPVRVSAAVTDGVFWFVEFWAEHITGTVKVDRTFQVFGTGHPLPSAAHWIATCPRTGHGLVWHLYEIGPVQTET